MSVEYVHKGFDNETVIEVFIDGQLADFSPITGMRVQFQGTNIEVDTRTQGQENMIDWSSGNGQIVFDFESLELFGTRKATLIAYDALHSNGQVLLHMDVHSLEFSFL